MQQLQIQTTNDNMLETASKQMLDREVLYNKDTNVLHVKYDGELRRIGSKVDNDNIILNDSEEIALADDVHCKTLTVAPDDSGLVYKDNVIFSSTTDSKTIILLFKIVSDASFGTIGGHFYEGLGSCTSAYDFSASTTGSRYIKGSTNGDKACYYRCTYGGEDYLGIKFNPNNTIYFSGYEYLPEGVKVNFDYTDSSFTTLVKLQDSADSGTVTKTIVSKYSINWDFTSIVSGLDSDNATTSGTEYDLTDGLYINKDFVGQVYFLPNEVQDDDTGLITVSGQGNALKLVVDSDIVNATLKIIFSSNADDERTLYISKTDASGAVQTLSSSSTDDVQTMTQSLDAGTTYYIGSTFSRIRIHRITLIYNDKVVVEQGWDAFDYSWDFTSTPDDWNTGVSVDWGNGLIMYRTATSGYYIATTATGSDRNNTFTDTGYIVVPSSGQNIFYIDVPNDESTLSVRFTTGRDGGYRTCSIINSDGTVLATAGNRNSTSSWYQSDTGITTITASDLTAGRYYIYASAELKIWKIELSNSGKETTYKEVASSEGIVSTINSLEETGENGDAHYLTIKNMVLTLEDLTNIADVLRNSDKKIHLDLSECTVASDATEWSGLFNKCTSLTYLSMPQGVISIGADTFVGCLFLEQIIFCDTVTTFTSGSNSYIFSGTRVRTIVLPKACASIGWNTFANSGLRHLVIPEDNENTFYSMLVYGSMFNTLDYVKVHMNATEYATHDWTLEWEHTNYFGDTADTTIAAHIIQYDDLDELLEELGYEE